jgi:hypothetical protein
MTPSFQKQFSQSASLTTLLGGSLSALFAAQFAESLGRTAFSSARVSSLPPIGETRGDTRRESFVSGLLSLIAALLLPCGLLLTGCADLKSDSASATTAEINLQGVWDGLSVNDCSPVQVDPSRCRAVERISFTMLRHDDRSWGFYSCAPGTTPCYNMVSRGEIKYLKLNGRMLWFRVMRDDHSSCLFNTVPGPDQMRGKFWCFDGDALIERGFWQAARIY